MSTGESQRLGVVEGFPEGQRINESIRKSFEEIQSSPEGLTLASKGAAKGNNQEAGNAPTEAIPECDPGSARNSRAPRLTTWNPIEILESIHGSIDWLHRLSNVVRSTGFDIQKHRAEGIDVPHLEGQRLFFEYLVARELHWPRGEHPMSKRLVNTMIKRRKLYLFRHSQTVRWTARNTNNERQRRREQPTQ